jgi:DNA-binding NarL/FixJ family response regulator
VALPIGQQEPFARALPPPANLLSRRLEAQATRLEQRAAELRSTAERLSEQARSLRATARQLSAPTSLAQRQRCQETRLTRRTSRPGPHTLTPRQQEIVGLIVRGATNRQIAQQLVITAGTTANHVAHLLNRLGLQNRVQLAAWAVEHPESWLGPIRPDMAIEQPDQSRLPAAIGGPAT